MASVNEQLRDADISHQVDMQQYANGVVRRIIALLNRTDSDLFAQLAAALEQMPPESFTVQRLEQLLYSVRSINAAAYAQVNGELQGEMRDLVDTRPASSTKCSLRRFRRASWRRSTSPP